MMLLNYDLTTQRHTYMLDRFQRNRIIGMKTRRELYHPAIRLLRKVCPSSIILRNYCLRDILLHQSRNKDIIWNLVDVLSYGGSIWAEGYSCWKITKRFLVEWGNASGDNSVDIFIRDIDAGFCKTAYRRKEVLDPAPFGDLKVWRAETVHTRGFGTLNLRPPGQPPRQRPCRATWSSGSAS